VLVCRFDQLLVGNRVGRTDFYRDLAVRFPRFSAVTQNVLVDT